MAIEEVDYTSSDTHSDYDSVKQESVFGGEEDLWGASEVTVSQLEDPTFQIEFDVEDAGGSLLMVESLEAEIFYSLPEESIPADVLELPSFSPTPYSSAAIGSGPTGLVRIVCVGDQGVIRATDDKGSTWLEKDSGVADILWGVTWDGEQFVAVGNNGTYLTSPDGDTWTKEDIGVTQHLYSVARDTRNRGVVVAGRNGEIHAKVGDQVSFSAGRIDP